MRQRQGGNDVESCVGGTQEAPCQEAQGKESSRSLRNKRNSYSKQPPALVTDLVSF